MLKQGFCLFDLLSQATGPQAAFGLVLFWSFLSSFGRVLTKGQRNRRSRWPSGSACQRDWLCVLGVTSPPITQLRGSRADPQHCVCLFLRPPGCRLQVWQGKCAVIITRGVNSCSKVETIVKALLVTKRGKGLSKHFLPAGAVCFH